MEKKIKLAESRTKELLPHLSAELSKKIIAAKAIVVLAGKEIAFASGVPTPEELEFEGFKYEELAEIDTFYRNPKLIWNWYRWRRKILNGILPNSSHYSLVRLEHYCLSEKKSFLLISQDVNGLHQRAGSQNVLEIHGNIMNNKCLACQQIINDDDSLNLPTCPNCGNILKAALISLGENVDPNLRAAAKKAAENSDFLITIDIEENLEPSASLSKIAQKNGAYLWKINSGSRQNSIPVDPGTIINELLAEVENIRAEEKELTEKVLTGKWKVNKVLILENSEDLSANYLQIFADWFAEETKNLLSAKITPDNDYLILAILTYSEKSLRADRQYKICFTVNNLSTLENDLQQLAIENWTQCSLLKK